MTTTSETTPKKSRRGAKSAAEPIEPVEATTAEGAPVEEASTDAASPDAAPAEAPTGMTWAEAAADASATEAACKADEWEWDESEEVIDITLSDADMADLLRANGADEDAKAAVDREIDTMKSNLKEKKAESEAIAARMKDRNRSGSRGVQSKKATWKVGTCFALNMARYVDPLTGRIVLERALRSDERQVALPLPEPGAQLERGDADDTDLTDPDALLAAAQAGEVSDDDDDHDGDGGNDGEEDEL